MTHLFTCPACGAPLAFSPEGGIAAACSACGRPWAERIAAPDSAASDIEVAAVVADEPVVFVEPVIVEEKEALEAPLVIDEPAIEAQIAIEPEPVFLSVGPVEQGPATPRKLPEGPWFLETPEGLRFGPATSEELTQWVAEGRVSLDCRIKGSTSLDFSPGDFFPGLKVPPRRAQHLPGMRQTAPRPPSSSPEKKPTPTPSPASPPGELTFRATHRGYWLLLLAICSWAACPVLGLLAWLMATHDLQEMQAGRMDGAGEPETSVALWLGLTHVIVSAAILVIGLIAGALALALQ